MKTLILILTAAALSGCAFDDMLRTFKAEYAGGQVLAVNEGVKMMKLVQAACGVLYDREGNHREIDCKPRVTLLKEIIDEAGQKVIPLGPGTTLKELGSELDKPVG